MGGDALEPEVFITLSEDTLYDILLQVFLWGEVSERMADDSEYPPMSFDDLAEEIFTEIYGESQDSS